MSLYTFPRTVLVENFRHNPHIGLFQMEHLPTIIKLMDDYPAPTVDTTSPFLGYFLWPYWCTRHVKTPNKSTQTSTVETRDVGCNTDKDPSMELGDQIIKKQEAQWQKV